MSGALCRAAAAGAQPSRDSLGRVPVPAGTARTVLVLDSIDLTAVSTLSELLQARVPGLLVQSGSGSAGAGARVTARGTRSVYGYGDPLLVIDGVRAVGTQRSFELDTAITISRLDDVVLEHVERVEVLRGPAAAALYGPGAANGAIVVTTRGGHRGPTRVGAYAQSGVMIDPTNYPLFYSGIGRYASGEEDACYVNGQVAGACALSRITQDDRFAQVPFRVGSRGAAGVHVGGGTRRARYFVAGDASLARGVTRGNDVNRLAVRANTDVDVARGLGVRMRSSVQRGVAALRPGEHASFVNYVTDAFGTPVFERGGPAEPGRQVARRGDGSVAITWAPSRWLRGRAAVGVSNVAREERHVQFDLARLASSTAPLDSTRVEARGDGHDWVASGAVGVTAGYALGGISLETDLGLDRFGSRRTDAVHVRAFAPRETVPGRQFARRSVESVDVRSATIVQRVWAGTRLRLNAGVRWNSLYDGLPQRQSDTDLSASGAWTVARLADGGALELVAAYGESTTPLSATLGHRSLLDCLGCFVSRGKAPPRESTREAEVGLGARLGRSVRVQVTAVSQNTSDVLISPASTDFGAPAFATVRNTALEANVEGTVGEGRAVELLVRAWGAAARNRVRDLGRPQVRLPSFVAPRVVTNGHPLGSVWRRDVTYADVNGDGAITDSEVQTGDEPTPYGPTRPTRTAAVEGRARLGTRATLGVVAEHRSGHVALGARPTLLSDAHPACFDRAQPLDDQAFCNSGAAAVSGAGFFESASFVRIRELSAAYTFGRPAHAMTVTLAMRNALTLTSFSGTDPESDALATTTIAYGGYFTQPLPATVSVRLTKSW